MIPNLVDKVRRVAPNARGNYLEAIAQGGPLFERGEVTTALRMAHFLAQALHETGRFTVLRESMDYSEQRLLEVFGVNKHSAAITAAEASRLAHNPERIAERVYGLGNPRKARELGNTEPGDGFRYRGNGILQMTGRGGHRVNGQACGVDFESDPDLATAPEHALQPSLQEWADSKLNSFADRNDIRTITRKINGGFNGLAERQALFEEAFALLRAEGDPTEAFRAGAADDEISALQQSLNDLGANPKLTIDGQLGPATRRAVSAFQAAAGIPVDGIPGPVTKAALELALGNTRGGQP